MAQLSLRQQWKITATVETALCIGDSGTSGTFADRTTVKTSDGRLYIPASTLKDLWRHACEALARSQGHFVCSSPRAASMCTQQHCIICQIFGSPNLASRIFINDLMGNTDLGAKSTEIRNGVTINRSRRVSEDGRLYFTETSVSNAGITFSGEVGFLGAITAGQTELLHAGLKYIHAVGTGKSRGLGWLDIKLVELEEPPPDSQAAASIEPDTGKFTELTIEVTLESPIVLGGRKSTGQAVEAVPYIRGGVIRGAMVKAWLADSENGGSDPAFRDIFLNDNAAIFRNCYPGPHVLPATATGCKDSAGFLKKEGQGKQGRHGIFDTLLERVVSEKAGWPYQPKCPHCENRIQAQSGFYTNSDDLYEKSTLNTRLLTRVAINRQRKVAEDELLYHLTAVDPVSAGEEKVCLRGAVSVPSTSVAQVVDILEKKVHWLGSGTSRGLGRVHVKVTKREAQDTLQSRIDNFNGELRQLWGTYCHLPPVTLGSFEGSYFTVNLQSDAILTTEDGWQRSMVLSAEMLQQVTGCNAPLKLIRSFASYDYVGGWNAAWGLPKETTLVTRMGSVFVFHTSYLDMWIPTLKTLESRGIGHRRAEGFGQVLICDPFHLRTREKVKNAADRLGRE